MVCTLLAGINVVAFAADDDDLVVGVHSFYNDVTKGGDGEHLYTKDQEEMSYLSLLGTWNDEDVAWNAPVSSSTAIWRCYNPNSGEHLYVPEGYADYLAGEHWNKEKVSFYSDDNQGVPVYRLWNGLDAVGSHYFTTDYAYALWLADTYGWKIEDIAFYGVKEEEPEDIEILSAEQTGANTIEFTVSRALTLTDEVDLLNGTTEQEMTYDVSEDGKTVEITSVAKLNDATYTVAVTPEEALLPVTMDVTCEEGKLAGIMFGPGLAFVSNQNFYTVATTLTGANQWGEEFNLNSGTMKVYPGVAAYDDGVVKDDEHPNVADKFTTGYDAEKNQYVLAKSDTIPFKVGDTVTMTAVYNDGNGNVIQETDELPVLSVPQVASMEFGDLSTTSPKLVGQRVTLKNFNTDSYYFPVEAYDQYGNELNKDSLNYALGTSMLFVNPTPANSTFGGFGGFDELEDGTVILKLEHSDKQIPGTGTITVSAIGGLSTSAKYEVEDNPYIASLSVVGMGDVIQGQSTQFGLVAVDQYGELFDLYSTSISGNGNDTLEFTKSINGLSGQVASVKVNNGRLGYVKSSSKKQVGFVYTPNNGFKNDVMTLTTSVPNVSTVQLSIKEKGKADSIKSTLNTVPDLSTRLTRDISEAQAGATLNLKAGEGLGIVDSNGIEMTEDLPTWVPYTDNNANETINDKYYYSVKTDKAKAKSGSNITVTNGIVENIGGDSEFTVYLKYRDKDGNVKTVDTETFKVKFTSGKYDDFAPVWLDTYTVFYTGKNDTQEHIQETEKKLALYGTDEYGVTAMIPVAKWLVTDNTGGIIDDPTGNILYYGLKVDDTERIKYLGTEATTLKGTATFTVWADSSDDDENKEEVGTLDVAYDNATPVAQAFAWTQWLGDPLNHGKLVGFADEMIDVAALSTMSGDGNKLVVQKAGPAYRFNYLLTTIDQYGLAMTGTQHYVVNGVDKQQTTSQADLELTQPGENTVKVSAKGLAEKTLYLVVNQ